MASETTNNKSYFHETLQRIRDADLMDISELALEADAELAWSVLCDENYVINGFRVDFALGNSFYVRKGLALYNGKLVKYLASPSPTQVELEDETTGNFRIDVVYIDAPGYTEDDSQTRVVMSSISRTNVTAEAVGTGNDTTKAFDLDQSGVDPHTLKVKLAGTQVGGWNYSKGTGGGGKDQIIFATAPGSGVAITADYTWQSGGVESSAGIWTRKNWGVPSFGVQIGTPGSFTPPSIPAGAVKLAEIKVPANWTGGLSGLNIYNDLNSTNIVKQFLVFADQTNEAIGYWPGDTPNAGKIFCAVRGKTQVVHGCRLQWAASNQITITPGWGVLGGISFRFHRNKTLTVTGSSVPSTGWYYVYAQVTIPPGGEPSIEISTAPPDSHQRDSSIAITGGIYLGAFYATASATIRPFYTHGDRVFWLDPTEIEINASTGTYALTVTNWIPETGKLFYARIAANYEGDVVGNACSVFVKSHRSATGKPEPSFEAHTATVVANIGIDFAGTGWVRAETNGSAREVHHTIVYNLMPGSSDNVHAGGLYVLGYVDDYRTLHEDGTDPFY